MKVYKLSIASLAFITSCTGAMAYKDETMSSIENFNTFEISNDYTSFLAASYAPLIASIDTPEVSTSATVIQESVQEHEQFSIVHDVLTRQYSYGERSDNVLQLQVYLDVYKDGHYGQQTRNAHIDALNKVGLNISYAPEPPVQAKPASLKLDNSIQSDSFQTCSQYHDLALSVGWSQEHLPRLSYIMWRESRCDPTVLNSKDPNGGSRGLTQINGYWCKRTKYSQHDAGYLGLQGILNSCNDLFDPKTNLIAAKELFDYGIERGTCPWRPWTTKKTSWCR